MARKGDGLYLRGKGKKELRTWWLDFRHDGQRHVMRIGKGITRSVAAEIARVKRAAVLKGEAGIASKPKRADVSFTKACEEFLRWAETNKKPKTVRGYRQCVKHLKASLATSSSARFAPLTWSATNEAG